MGVVFSRMRGYLEGGSPGGAVLWRARNSAMACSLNPASASVDDHSGGRPFKSPLTCI